MIQKQTHLLYFLLALSCFSLNSCREKETPESPIIVKYLALGDSYTIGQGVDTLDRWPNQLRAKLISNGIDVQKTDIIAQTGWRTSNLLNALGNNALDGYNLISLLIGVNNEFWGEPFDIFQSEFDSLLNIAIDLVGKDRLFIVSIPDYGVTPFGSNNSENIAENIDMYNNYIQERCSNEGLTYINITEISRQLGDSEGALASDNLHPSGSQYAQWVNQMLPVVLGLIND